jgi:hypothetical protein
MISSIAVSAPIVQWEVKNRILKKIQKILKKLRKKNKYQENCINEKKNTHEQKHRYMTGKNSLVLQLTLMQLIK